MIRQLRHFLGTLRQLSLTNSSSSMGQWSSCHLCTSLTDTGRSSILSRTCNGATCLGVRTCLPYFLPQGRQDLFPSGYRHLKDGCRNPFARSRSLCCYYQGWSHRTEFNRMHFLMMYVGARVLFQIFKEKKCYWNVFGSFNIRRNSIFSSCFTLLGFFLSAKS